MTRRPHVDQIPLGLSFPERTRRDDWIAGVSNHSALAWIDRWPEWGGACGLVLVGPAGSGKSHLSHIWCDQAGGVVIGPADITDDVLTQPVVPRVIDQVDTIIGDRARETILFHLYNQAREQRSSLVFPMRTRPALLPFALPDLQSRIKSLPCAVIDAPDDALLAAIIRKHAQDRRLAIDPAVIDYILPRMDRSFAGARDVVARLDHLALAEKRPVSVALARQVLAEDGINESAS